VYDNETDVEIVMPAKASNGTGSVISVLPQVHAKLIKVNKVTYASGELNGANRFAIRNGNNNATTPAVITAEWAPVNDGNEVFKGAEVSLAQTQADGNNVQIAVTATLHFALDV
jgi:hypothetical protein